MQPLLYESHLHTPLCKHAQGEPEEYAATAAQRGLAGIIVTCHNPPVDGWSPHVRMAESQFDAYVDMVGRDIYNNGSETDMAAQFTAIQESYPNKMVTLSEFGNVATFSKQWNAGAHWSFFMPWYDYSRTLNPGSATFEGEDHEYAPAAWWKNAAVHEAVLWREDMPNLK